MGLKSSNVAVTPTPFTYFLHENSGWPPTARPKVPLGPTAIEIARSCALRSFFDASPGYERKMDFAARVGMAFHRTLQSFYEKDLPDRQDKAMHEARKRFMEELSSQEADATTRPRERWLPHDATRVDRALEALTLEAIRYTETNFNPALPVHQKIGESPLSDYISGPGPAPSPLPPIEVEVLVQSKDKLLRGRIDRVEHSNEGTILYDFKSALRDDLPERYQRQLQLYAFMWYETRGEWPTAGYVVYPLAGKTYKVSIDPMTCQRTADEAISIIHRLETEPISAKLATPGEACTVCDYRPWCKPFWTRQAEEKSLLRAFEQAALGFSGSITRLELNNHRWHLTISWRNGNVRLSAPEERLPHMHKAQAGQIALVLDAKLQGSPQSPLAIFTEYSELFLVQQG